MEKQDSDIFYRRNLPHWHVPGAVYFVTFRLNGSLPSSIVKQLQALKSLKDASAEEERLTIDRRIFRLVEQTLDQPHADIVYLREPKIAELIVKAIDYAETEWGWKIPSYVIMPNHVHMLMTGESANRSLMKCLGGIKGFTARKANELLDREGIFWQHESFDHWCRTAQEAEGVTRYIRNNPVKAGLVENWEDWPWVR